MSDVESPEPTPSVEEELPADQLAADGDAVVDGLEEDEGAE